MRNIGTEMKPSVRKHHALVEHYLVPLALFVLNTCTVHVIYTYSSGSWDSYWHIIALTISLVALAGALLVKSRRLLICSVMGYLLLLVCLW